MTHDMSSELGQIPGTRHPGSSLDYRSRVEHSHSRVHRAHLDPEMTNYDSGRARRTDWGSGKIL